MNRDEIAPELIAALEHLMDEYGPLGTLRVTRMLYAEKAGITELEAVRRRVPGYDPAERFYLRFEYEQQPENADRGYRQPYPGHPADQVVIGNGWFVGGGH